MMQFEVAQREISVGNAGGAPGVLVSGLVWLIASLIWSRLGIGAAFATLFVGGMLIVPASLLIVRLIFRVPKVAPDNPLNRLGLESTFFLFAGILVAYGLLRAAPEFVFPTMAIAIGARYFIFRTLYDQPLYWILAAAIVGAGALDMLGWISWPGNLALVVGMVEVGFAIILFTRRQRGNSAR